ncbi:MAG: hypothetical protein M3336_12480 [Chloroflexota bacterium]|nr:hypothetical protein [Chloroflexota bacterium]
MATQQQQRSVFGSAVQAVVLLLLLAILAAVLLMLFALASLLNAPGQVVGGVGSRLSGATAEAGRVVGGAQQALQNLTDPNRPPTGLVYDTEYSALYTWRVGERLPDAGQYVLTLQLVRRREGTDSPDTGQFAVVHAELRQPRETRVFGQLLRSDSDPREHVLYKGETFRIGRTLYRVNWVSLEAQSMAAAQYRHPDAVSGPFKFEYD